MLLGEREISVQHDQGQKELWGLHPVCGEGQLQCFQGGGKLAEGWSCLSFERGTDEFRSMAEFQHISAYMEVRSRLKK